MQHLKGNQPTEVNHYCCVCAAWYRIKNFILLPHCFILTFIHLYIKLQLITILKRVTLYMYV